MPRNLYVNLPVKDLERTVGFFAALGFSFNPKFTDENATCMIINDSTSVMLLVESFFATFTRKPVADAHQATEALLCIGLRSRAEVDAMVTAALAAGGKEPRAAHDPGWMYSRSFEDLDGHVWEPMYSDLSQLPGA